MNTLALLRNLTAALILSFTLAAIGPEDVPVQVAHEKGSFKGNIQVRLEGNQSSAKIHWNGTITNTSGHTIFRATFCTKALDPAGQLITPGGNSCILSLWGTNWAAGAALNFKGDQRIKISDSKEPAAVSRYSIELAEIFDTTPNTRTINATCNAVWPAVLRTFADLKFRPTVLEKESLIATFAYEGGVSGGAGVKNFLRTYTNANTKFFGPTWEAIRIDSASSYLREADPGICSVELKMAFAAFGKVPFGARTWYALDSSFNYEKQILDTIEKQVEQSETKATDKAIAALPTDQPQKEKVGVAKLELLSEPDGAEIEIDGEFIGNTPSTVTISAGPHEIVIRKSGFLPWVRKLNVAQGDTRTIRSSLETFQQ